MIKLTELKMKQVSYERAKYYIKDNHYSHSIPASVKIALGFYCKTELITMIVYGCPVGRNVNQWLGTDSDNCLELVRLFSNDGLPKNMESYCIGQSFLFLKTKYPQYKYLISYADPNHNHVGYIYQATYIDGKEVHCRVLNSKHGSTSEEKLKEIYGDRLTITTALKKHVYIMCLGNKKEKKERRFTNSK